jgi:hypothetical protein
MLGTPVKSIITAVKTWAPPAPKAGKNVTPMTAKILKIDSKG